jgi:hypothetical protein
MTAFIETFITNCRHCGESIHMCKTEKGRWLPFNKRNQTIHLKTCTSAPALTSLRSQGFVEHNGTFYRDSGPPRNDTPWK